MKAALVLALPLAASLASAQTPPEPTEPPRSSVREALRARAAEVARLRAEGRPTVPSTLAQEQATNPFLRAYIPEVKAAVGLSEAEDSEVFAALRAAKDRF